LLYRVLLLTALLFLAISHANAEGMINTEKNYSYDMLLQDMDQLKKRYPYVIQQHLIGHTEFGRKIWAIKLGKGKKATVLLHGAHHGREWMTSMLLMKMTETYADAFEHNSTVDGYFAEILEKTAIWIVPMVNPDGVELQQKGLSAFPKTAHERLICMNEGSNNFQRWKANGQGVDLNRQYPVGWEKVSGDSPNPSYKFYKGEQPLSAKEVQALAEFTKTINPKIAIAYHSSGREIFGDLKNKQLLDKLTELTNYKPSKPEKRAQGAGFTDWFLHEFSGSGYTIEIGPLVEETSLPTSVFPEVWERNRAIGLMLAHETTTENDRPGWVEIMKRFMLGQ
jgi:g-D-glutamyl-meso-diaminopimelate peptidase